MAAKSVDDFIAGLPADRRAAIAAVRKTIVKNLPKGYEEVMYGSMPSYVVPLSRYPKTYNKQPLMYAALASQKNHMAVYLMGVYSAPGGEAKFRQAYEAAGKKIDMGKSCVRFKALEDLPLAVIGQTIAAVPVEAFIKTYEASRAQ